MMRTERYRDLIPPERLTACACTVVGVGAVGRQVALQLAAMGVGAVQLVDHDVVEEVNLGPQAYLEADVGRPKVGATAELMRRLNSAVRIEAVQERFARTQEMAPVLFCCVDSIATRRHIWGAVSGRVDLFVDGRMAAEVLRVLTVTDARSRERYDGTLFAAEEALREGCTARATVYCASVAAGLMVGQLARWLRGLPTEFDVLLNLMAGEWAVA